jgi:hypothetical protein
LPQEDSFIKLKEFVTLAPVLVLPNCKGNLTGLRRELHLSLAKGNPKRML